MKINWRLRFKNKATLVALLTGVVAFIYQILGLCGVTPSISESDIINTIGMLINMAVLMGVVVDPTTEGVSDSDKANTYYVPKKDYYFTDEEIEEMEQEVSVDDRVESEVE